MVDIAGLLSGKLNSGLFLSDPQPPKGGLNWDAKFRSPLGDLGVREIQNHNILSYKIYD